MKQFIYASVLAAGCTAALAAQAGTADQAKSKESMGKDAGKTVTVTGCVAESDGRFMLNNATMAEGGSPMAYALTGGALKPHVGHKVAVTGMMKPMAGGDMKGGMGAGGTGTGATGTGAGATGAGAGATGAGAGATGAGHGATGTGTGTGAGATGTGAGAGAGATTGGAATGSATGGMAGGTAKGGAMMKAHGTVAVESVKMIAATCS
jgi:hypothetical protein